MSKISPFLWFTDQAEEAAEFYVSLFPNSRVTNVSRYPEGSGPLSGTALAVSFELDGVDFQAMNGGPGHPFTDAISLFVYVESQADIDRLWDALISDGGAPSRCGWLLDRWGVSWQIVPPLLGELLSDPDPEKAGRTMQAMMGMSKLDMSALQAAHDGS
jgi:predicted 3-demethylubiquinone-9 3-methyltransferase (glyoxalase superfamily)